MRAAGREALDGKPTEAEIQEESRRVRRLQIMVSLVMNVIMQGDLSLEEASELVASTKRAAMNLFPDKELAYDLIYKPRLQRLMMEKYRMH
jgi:predicted HTH domain antitoxin